MNNEPIGLAGLTTARRPSSVVCISLHYAPEELGTGPVIAPLIEKLAELTESTDVITARPHYPEQVVPPEYAHGQRDREILNGVRVTRCRTRPPKNRNAIARLANEVSFCWGVLRNRLSGQVKRAPFVVAVCPTVLSVLLAPLFKRRKGRLVAIVHDIQSGVGQTLGYGQGSVIIRLLRQIEKLAFNQVDALVALSESMKESLLALGVRKPIYVLPPQVDTCLIVPQPEPTTSPPLILYSGNLGHKQGLVQLLDLAEILERRGREFRMVIRGEGNQRELLSAEIARRGLRHVTLAPLRPRAELAKGLSEGIVHLVPQLPEGAGAAMPSKIFSIMAAGRPFVATANAGSPLWKFAEDVGACICTEPFDAEAFADAVQSLLDDPANRREMGQKGRDYVEREASNQVVLDRLCKIVLGEYKQDPHEPTKRPPNGISGAPSKPTASRPAAL